jgi:hypothetical protein
MLRRLSFFFYFYNCFPQHPAKIVSAVGNFYGSAYFPLPATTHLK